jgi:hypothetical protein
MAKDGDELRMRRRGDRDRDELGIRMRGAVLEGERSVESRLREDGMKYSPDGERIERYRDARDYDPVLRGHCRLDER